MAFTFGKSEIEFEYQGKSYSLKVDARLAVNLERHINMHPLTLLIKINKDAIAGEMPPMGLMAEVFEFMLKKAGAPVDFDEIYAELFGGESQAEIAGIVGDLLTLFVPTTTDTPKTKPKRQVRK
tara:strand:- start:346 stop:717 length:372 start_codon:yes stop_codon:yes gene_type:complete